LCSSQHSIDTAAGRTGPDTTIIEGRSSVRSWQQFERDAAAASEADRYEEDNASSNHVSA